MLGLVWTLQWLFAWPATLGIGATLAYVGLVGFVQIRLFPRLQEWKRLRAGLLLTLAAARSLGELGVACRGRLYGALTDDLAEIGRLDAVISGRLYDRFAAIAEYANLFAMSEYTTLRRSLERFEAALPSLCRVYEQVAECEADICFLEHALATDQICVAKLAAEGDVVFTDLKNPLFDDCQPLSLRMDDKSLLLSGQNGIGKSTLLRAIGINLLVARAFGVCYATHARVPEVIVWVSIENKDSIENSQSLYMAELLRAETLVKAAEAAGKGAFFIIDEIFRGTNNIESVAAAAAVLQHLAAHARVVVTSHNLALGKILRRRYRSLHLARTQGKGLILEDGLLPDTNGIALMGRYDFPPSVLREADRVRTWYSEYVLQPADFPLEEGSGSDPTHSPPNVSAAFTSSSSNPIR
ncbi:MutS-related protein [Roseateles chitinivorans]|uniref:MutS-related protein n=1 Tax=Roseateles chitinivorans TaxID=2917965 RepID=UPI003D67E912